MYYCQVHRNSNKRSPARSLRPQGYFGNAATRIITKFYHGDVALHIWGQRAWEQTDFHATRPTGNEEPSTELEGKPPRNTSVPG